MDNQDCIILTNEDANEIAIADDDGFTLVKTFEKPKRSTRVISTNEDSNEKVDDDDGFSLVRIFGKPKRLTSIGNESNKICHSLSEQNFKKTNARNISKLVSIFKFLLKILLL